MNAKSEVRVITLTASDLEAMIERAAQTAASKVEGPREVLTTDEAAELLRFSTQVVIRLIQDAGLPARRLGREWRFFRSELLAWLSAQPTKVA